MTSQHKKIKISRYLLSLLFIGGVFLFGANFSIKVSKAVTATPKVAVTTNKVDTKNPNADKGQQKYVYPLHEKIPGQNGRAGQGKDNVVDTLQEYLESLYKFGIAIVAILAVVMIGVGAFMYIVTSAGNAGKLANAKEIITNAIVGLVMALLAWLILFIINPDLVGTTLTPPTMQPNIYIDDGKPDAMCSNEGSGYQQVANCTGNNFCLDGQCQSKTKLCDAWQVPFILPPFDCDKFNLAEPGQPCGAITGNGSFAGSCTSESIKECAGTQVKAPNGKQCRDSVCCIFL